MAALVLSLLVVAMAGHTSATWCVCKTGLSDAALQKTIDYACGHGADCTPTHPKGPCYSPDTVRGHCNYAVNSYFQKSNQAAGTCDFSGTATPVNTDPSYAGCAFPASASAAGGSTTVTPGTSSPKGNTPTSTTTIPGGNSPYSATPTTGMLGGNGTDATGAGINPDYSSDTGFGFRSSNNMFFCLVLIVSSGLCSVSML